MQPAADRAPQLFGRYKTLMRYKALAKCLRQAAGIADPVPASVVSDGPPAPPPGRGDASGAGGGDVPAGRAERGLRDARDYYAVESHLAAARTWTHVAAVYDAAAKRRSVYYDGVRVGVSEGVSVGPVTSALFYLGRKQSSETDWFKGRLDDVAVWDCALTPEQVRRLCREELPRAGKPLVPPGTALAVSAGARLTLERGAARLTGRSRVRAR